MKLKNKMVESKLKKKKKKKQNKKLVRGQGILELVNDESFTSTNLGMIMGL